jgi:hypothetical protein
LRLHLPGSRISIGRTAAICVTSPKRRLKSLESRAFPQKWIPKKSSSDAAKA